MASREERPDENAAYDPIAAEYINHVEKHTADERSVHAVAVRALLMLAGDLRGKRICDLACGEGFLSRLLADRGAEVTGVDLSERLVEAARNRSAGARIRYLVDDAQSLPRLPDSTFDTVVCNLALMDIPDLAAALAAVHRILLPGGVFVCTITHPCFQAPGSGISLNADGSFGAKSINRYGQEGKWYSDNPHGIRGKVGAYHRTLSTYLNEIIRAGLRTERISEPLLETVGSPDPFLQAHAEIPVVLALRSVKPA